MPMPGSGAPGLPINTQSKPASTSIRSLTGQGLGKILYKDLLKRLKELDIHVVLGGITLPNPVSVALHEKLGFKKVAHFKEVGYKFGRWLDVGFWQLNLEK